ncbi:MAG TPA: hypothetical protein VMM17_03870 [Gemmatimonadaceae bacterium]|nr:hypothetical protein [Gemmatimonadaceae bacterium]
MKKLALLLPAALLFAACSETPSEPPMGRPSFDNPPPPKLAGTGFLALGDEQVEALSLTIQSQSCEDLGEGPLAVAFPIEGDYFQNPPGNQAWVQFNPVGGTGQGWIRERGEELPVPPDPVEDLTLEAGGLVKYNQDGIDYQVRLLSYEGTPLRRQEGSDGFGFIGGQLTAEVRACGRREIAQGFINYNWGFDDCEFCDQ